jgi:hypothetical protein
VFWRVLVTQACLYRALWHPEYRDRQTLTISDLTDLTDGEIEEFDWRRRENQANAHPCAEGMMA